MITLKVLLCAQDVCRDADTNTVSVFNVLDGIAGDGFPLLVQNFAMLAILEREAGDETQPKATMDLRIGDTVLLNAAPLPIDFKDKLRTRQTVRIGGLVLPAPGVLEATLKLGDNVLGVYRVHVTTTRKPEVSTASIPS